MANGGATGRWAGSLAPVFFRGRESEILATRRRVVAAMALRGRRAPRRHDATSRRARGRSEASGRAPRDAGERARSNFRALRADYPARGLLPAAPRTAGSQLTGPRRARARLARAPRLERG